MKPFVHRRRQTIALLLAALLAAGTLAGWWAWTAGPTRDPNVSESQGNVHEPLRKQVVAAAMKHLRRHRPEWLAKTDRPAVVHEKNGYYEVTWQLPPGTLGGSPVVHVEKDSLRAIKLYHTQ